MAEGPEHAFLKEKFIEVLYDFSQLKLYGFKETERKKFDFSCTLTRDWSRPLVGQTVWKNTKGMDKDIRLLISDKESEIKAYLARDTIEHRLLLEEVVSDFRKVTPKQLFKLKVFWITQDFDADEVAQRNLVFDNLRNLIVKDILFNVVFGNLLPQDLELFLDVSGIVGLNIALLCEIATNGFFNIPDMSKRLHTSKGPIREKLILLKSRELLKGDFNEITPKGRALFDIIGRLRQELQAENLSPELQYILTKLGCEVVGRTKVEANKEVFSENPYITLVKTMDYAVGHWELPLGRNVPIHL